jgi:hypothetical protein
LVYSGLAPDRTIGPDMGRFSSATAEGNGSILESRHQEAKSMPRRARRAARIL